MKLSGVVRRDDEIRHFPRGRDDNGCDLIDGGETVCVCKWGDEIYGAGREWTGLE